MDSDPTPNVSGLPQWLTGKKSACKAGNTGVAGSISGSGRSPGGGLGKSLQYSCLENLKDRGAWWAIVHGVAKSWTLKQLSMHAHPMFQVLKWCIFVVCVCVYCLTTYRWIRMWKPLSCVLTLCDPMDYTVHEILQARILEWVVIPFSGRSSQLRNQTQVSHTAGRFFTSWAMREAHRCTCRYVIPYIGNPLQCSCLENPRDGGAWWVAIYGVAQSRTRLKQLSSSSNCKKKKRSMSILGINFQVWGTFLVVQWPRLCTPNAGGPGSIPGQRTRSHMPQLGVLMPQLK